MRTRMLGILTAGVVIVALALGLTTVALAQGPMGNRGNGGMMGNWGRGDMMGNGGMMGGRMGPGWGATTSGQLYDLQFLDQMIAHHQMGVMMTQHMAEDSDRAEMRDLANRIITAQQREITQMQQWRQQWYPDAPRSTTMGPGMMGGMMGRGMMGRMHPNADFDLMFLQMMIPHHQDAIDMVNEALTKAERQEIKTLSQNIVATQTAEITEMRGYLKAWYGIK